MFSDYQLVPSTVLSILHKIGMVLAFIVFMLKLSWQMLIIIVIKDIKKSYSVLPSQKELTAEN